jgi:hypothetical protein
MLRLALDAADRELALHPGFPALVAGAIDWLAAGAPTTAHAVDAGEPYELRHAASQTRVVGPTGDPVPARMRGNMLVVDATREAGVYTSQPGRPFAVNVPAYAESDLRTSAPSRVADDQPVAPTAGAAGSDATAWMLVLVLLLLGAEYSLRHPMRSRSSS